MSKIHGRQPRPPAGARPPSSIWRGRANSARAGKRASSVHSGAALNGASRFASTPMLGVRRTRFAVLAWWLSLAMAILILILAWQLQSDYGNHPEAVAALVTVLGAVTVVLGLVMAICVVVALVRDRGLSRVGSGLLAALLIVQFFFGWLSFQFASLNQERGTAATVAWALVSLLLIFVSGVLILRRPGS